jgi:hypothetical protein
MARKPEAVFSDYIHANLQGVDISRVESGVNLGFPDMMLADKNTGEIAFLENKVVSAGQSVKLRPHQVSFAYRHWSYGVNCFVFVKHVLKGKRSGKLHLYTGGQALALASQGLRETPLCSWDYPVAGQWDEIRKTLFGSFSR